jgi:outer membrane protein assembly factor BamB
VLHLSKLSRIVLAACVAFGCLFAAWQSGAAPAESHWPQLLGPTRDGVYTGRWSTESSFTRLWSRPAGEGYSLPAVAGGRVILFHRQGNEEKVEALDAATGKTIWTFGYPTSYRDDFGLGDGPRAAPAIDGDRVYTYGPEAVLTCLDWKTGKKRWSIDGRKEFGVRKEFFGAAPSPLIEGDRLLLNIGGAHAAGIVALNKLTGTVIWKALNDEAGYASPTVATIGGERHALFFTRNGLVDADPATGRIRFQFRWRSRSAASVNAATPLVIGNRVFLSASYGTGATLLEIGGESPRQIWSGDDSLSNHYSTSVHKDGYLYGWHGRQEMGQELRCVELKTGRVQWSVSGLGAGTVTLAGSHLFVLRESGELLIGLASPQGWKVARRVALLPGIVRAYPAFAEGRLFVRNGDTLAAFKID